MADIKHNKNKLKVNQKITKTKKQYGGSSSVRSSNNSNINIDSALANALQNKVITNEKHFKQLTIKYTFLYALINRPKPIDVKNIDIFTYYIPDEYYNKPEYLKLISQILIQNHFAKSSDNTRKTKNFKYINRKVVTYNNMYLRQNEVITNIIDDKTIGIIIYFNIPE